MYGASTYLAEFHLTPFLWSYHTSFSSPFFLSHKNLKPFPVLQLLLHKPGGFSLGSEKLIPRFPLSHISTARALSRAEPGSERRVREPGHFPRPDSSWNRSMKLLLQRAVGAGPRRARGGTASSGGREAVTPRCRLRSIPATPRGGGSWRSPVTCPATRAVAAPSGAAAERMLTAARSRRCLRSWHPALHGTRRAPPDPGTAAPTFPAPSPVPETPGRQLPWQGAAPAGSGVIDTAIMRLHLGTAVIVLDRAV